MTGTLAQLTWWPQSEANWVVEKTRVKRTASIGSNATIVSGVTIGREQLLRLTIL